MYPQMVYHADVRAREKALAARERDMGCSCCAPLGRMISRFIMKCNGREGRLRYDERMGMDYAMACAPAQTCYVRPTAARTVTLAAATTSHHPTNAHADHPDRPHPPRAHATTTTTTLPPSFAPAGAPAQRKPRKKKKKHVRFTSPGAPGVPAGSGAPPPHDAGTAASGGGSAYHHHGPPPADPSSYSPAPPPAAAHGGGHGGYGYAYGYGRYAPSPLPRWEMVGTPRRPEYFSGEYRWCYPTPVREGIYSIATDAGGRLTTVFSEENPNACAIV